MIIFKCPRCGQESTHKNNMRKHYTRKRPCNITFEDISINECKFMLENKKLRKEKINIKEHLKLEKENTDLVKIVLNLQEEMSDMRKTILELSKNQGSNNDNSINKTTNHINININSYKDTDYKVVEKALITCIKRNGEIDMGKLIKTVHFNKDIPQNHNIYISDGRSNKIMKYDGEKFIYSGKGEEGIDVVIKEKLDDIDNHQELDDNLKGTSDDMGVMFDNKNTTDKRSIRDRVSRELYNNREMVIKTNKLMINCGI